MLDRVLEPEVMDTPDEARDYDAMDHAEVNRVFIADFLQIWNRRGPIVDVGTGTAQIPIEFCRQSTEGTVIAVDLAGSMLEVGRKNVSAAGRNDRIELVEADAKALPYPDGCFPALMSNSIVHHIPDPKAVFVEMARVTGSGATLFVRDLLRPKDEGQLEQLVETYAHDANAHQRQMFADSLRAALTMNEIRDIVAGLGFVPEDVRQTTDRHWTWATHRVVP